MRRTVPPSAEIEKKTDELLAGGVAAGDPEGTLSGLAPPRVRLIIQRASPERVNEQLGARRALRVAIETQRSLISPGQRH